MLSCRRPSFSYLFERRSCSSIVLNKDGEIEQIAALVHTNCVNVSNSKVWILGEKVLNVVSFGVLRLFHVPVNLTSYHIVKLQLAKRFHLESCKYSVITGHAAWMTRDGCQPRRE